MLVAAASPTRFFCLDFRFCFPEFVLDPAYGAATLVFASAKCAMLEICRCRPLMQISNYKRGARYPPRTRTRTESTQNSQNCSGRICNATDGAAAMPRRRRSLREECSLEIAVISVWIYFSKACTKMTQLIPRPCCKFAPRVPLSGQTALKYAAVVTRGRKPILFHSTLRRGNLKMAHIFARTNFEPAEQTTRGFVDHQPRFRYSGSFNTESNCETLPNIWFTKATDL